MRVRLLLLAGIILLMRCQYLPDIKLPPLPIPSPVPTAAPSPSPSVEPTPTPTPEPSPSPSPSPSATPAPSPRPSPSPCVVSSPPPATCVHPDGCVSCAQYVAHALAGGHLTRLSNGLLYNDPGNDPSRREYVDPRTCFYVWPDGSLRNKRLQKSGEVCPDCTPAPAATPCPPPTAPPSSPAPIPTGAPPLTESGNFPVPPSGVCPTWFANARSEIGIGVLQQRKCTGRDAPPDCTITKLNATEKSIKPYCEHSCYDEQGRYALSNCRLKCELLKACQAPEHVNGNSGIQMRIFHDDWGHYGDCDKQTAEGTFPDTRLNHLCHDRAENRQGQTFARACAEDGTQCGPTTTYRSLP